MKIRRFEKLAIAATVLIFACFAGYAYGQNAAGGGAFFVHTQRDAPEAAVILGGDALVVQLPENAPTPEPSAPAQTLAPGETPAPSERENAASMESIASGGGKVNINTAGEDELCTLPGIGPVLAERIITYRKEHGLFATREGIMDVRGIGEGIYDNLKDFITVREDEA